MSRLVALITPLLLGLSCAHNPPVVDAPASPATPAGPSAADIEAAREQFMAGRALAAQGRHGEALPRFEAAARSYPTWALAHLEEARCRMMLADAEPAVRAALDRALTLAPANPRVHFAWGMFHENAGRDAEAQQAYRQALEYRQSYPDALYRLALLQERSGAKAEALDSYARAYALQAENTGAALGAARLAEQTGDAGRAEALLLRLTRVHPRNLSFQTRLAEFYERQGEPRKARRLRQAIDRAARPERELRPLRPSRR